MRIIDKIKGIENQIEKLQESLIELKKIQCQIDEKETEIKRMGIELHGKEYNAVLDKIELRDKLHDEILDIEWDAKTNEERIDSRKHNIKYFRKLDYPNFKKENYAYEFMVIEYTESLFKVIPIIDAVRGVNKRPKLLIIKEWLHQELLGLLYSRKEIRLQEYSEFLEWMGVFVTKRLYKDLEELEKESITFFLEKIKMIHKFENKEVKFWY